MGTLRTGATLVVLHARHLIGRSRTMATSLAAPDVSAEHAVVAWRDDRWVARDLGSRNGTEVNGRRLAIGEEVDLHPGDVVTIGLRPHRFEVVSVAPPGPVAWSGDELVEGEPDWLALPDPDEPEALIEIDPEQGWVVATDAARRPARSGDVLTAGGRAWTLRLPDAVERTVSRALTRSQAVVGLRFRVSRDEEHVELDVVRDGVVTALKPRAHQYALLTLARERLRDAAEGVGATEQGWVRYEQLARMLRCSQNNVHVSLHRARKELAACGVDDPHGIVETRAGSHALRLAIRDVVISPLA